jgi:PhnB protein
MKSANVTILFDGQAEAAMNFYKSIFGGEFVNFQRMSDIPNAPEMPESEAKKVLHSSLPLGNSFISAMDMPMHRGKLNSGNSFMVQIDTESEAETQKLFEGLSDGANITMPLENQFWGAYFGMLTDKFGIQWMLSFETK